MIKEAEEYYKQFDEFRERLKEYQKGDLISKLDFQTGLEQGFAGDAVTLGILEDPGYQESCYVKGVDLVDGLSSEKALELVDDLEVDIPYQLDDGSIENEYWVQDLVYRSFKPKELQDLFFEGMGGNKDLDCLGFRLFRVKIWNACVKEIDKYWNLKKDHDELHYGLSLSEGSED